MVNGADAGGANAGGSGRNPGPSSVELPAAIRDQLVASARAEYPNEMAGLIVGDPL